jgi:predicted amidohydrolase YtcJ
VFRDRIDEHAGSLANHTLQRHPIDIPRRRVENQAMTAFADLVLTDTRVWGTEDTAVAVRSDRIVAVGDEATRELIGPRTEVLDRPGKLVVAGFQDSHVHPSHAGYERGSIDLHDLPDRQAYLDSIVSYAENHPDVEWLVGGGWAMEHFPGGTPHRAELDAVTGGRPAFLYNRDVHGAWVNSAALERAGIDASTPDPTDGRYERDTDGAPTGMLHEGAAYSFRTRWVPEPTRADWEDAILLAQEHLFSLGITGFQDAWVTPETHAAYSSLAADGRLRARAVGALWWDRHSGLDQLAQFRTQREGAIGRFHPTTVKIMVDGVIENRTASMIEPYCGGCDADSPHGLDYVDRDLLIAAVTELDALGFQVHMHAIGDRAVRNALDAVAAARNSNGPSDNRHHIAHVQVIQPEDVPRFSQLDVIANCQTFWAQTEPQMDELTIPLIGRDRAQLQYPFEALRAAGVRLAMGSDWAVTTADPLQQMEVAIRRIDPEHRDNAPFLPEQALSLNDALTAFTAGSAYTNHDPDAGRIEVGARADLAVLDEDLARLSGKLSDASVVCTVAAGEIVYRD